MEKINQGHPMSQSPDFVKDNIELLKSLFPTIVKEGKIVMEELEALLGEDVEKEEEYYNFTWAGKSMARREANKPSTATLRPDKSESKDWDTTGNVFIEGDNLEVLKLLQKSYANKVKMIYIDPPYNTTKDFIYSDDYADNLTNYLETTGQLDENLKKKSTKLDLSGRFHSNWLNMIYPRLKLSRSLMSEDGVIFISIDDNEVFNLRKVCDEIFGQENFICQLIWNKQHSQQQGLFKKYHEYILVYAKNEGSHSNISGGEGIIDAGALKKVSKGNPESTFSFPAGVRFEATEGAVITGVFGDSEKVKVINGKMICENGKLKEPVTLSAGWTQKDQMIKYFNGEEVFDTKGQKVLEFYFNSKGKLKCLKERSKITPSTLLPEYGMVSFQTAYLASLFDNVPVFDNPKPVNMILDFISWFCNDDDIILDFFAGSGTTMEATMKLNSIDGGKRKYIGVQLQEKVKETESAFQLGFKTISEITKERIRRAGDKIISEISKDLLTNSETDLDIGFRAFKLDSSNIRTWDGNPGKLEENLFTAGKNIKEDRTEEDVLFEILLKYGLDLTVPIEEKSVNSKMVYSVGYGTLFICLSDNITTEVADAIGQWKEKLEPPTSRVIFKDSGFNDVQKTNSIQILKRFGIIEVNTI